MPKKKTADRAHEFTALEIQAVVRQLTSAAEVFTEFHELIEQQPTKTLASHNRLTIERALVNLESSVAAIQKAMWLHRAGTPLVPGQLKPQSPFRKPVDDKQKT
jgi:hypothetical protein